MAKACNKGLRVLSRPTMIVWIALFCQLNASLSCDDVVTFRWNGTLAKHVG